MFGYLKPDQVARAKEINGEKPEIKLDAEQIKTVNFIVSGLGEPDHFATYYKYAERKFFDCPDLQDAILALLAPSLIAFKEKEEARSNDLTKEAKRENRNEMEKLEKMTSDELAALKRQSKAREEERQKARRGAAKGAASGALSA